MIQFLQSGDAVWGYSGEFVIAQHQIPQRSFQATEGHAGDGVQVIVFNFKSPGSWEKILDVIGFICKENVDKSNDQDIHMSIKWCGQVAQLIRSNHSPISRSFPTGNFRIPFPARERAKIRVFSSWCGRSASGTP